MRGAFGKPYGLVARVRIGQVIMSVRSKDANKEHVVESLRRAKFKFPGRQKVILSRKMGFTPFDRERYQELKDNNRLVQAGSHVKYIPEHGRL